MTASPGDPTTPARTAEDLRVRAAAAYREVVIHPGSATASVERLVVETRESADPEALVLALRALGWAERTRLAESRAKVLLDEAAALARRHGLSARLGEVLTSRGAVNLELGRVGAARQDLEHAKNLMAGDGTPELWHQQAVLFHNLGDLGEAERIYRRVLASRDASPEVRAKVWNNVALIDIARGRVDASYAALAAAAAAADEAGPALVAIVAQSRGWVTVQAGRLAESLGQFDAASTLYRAAGLPLGEHYLEYVDALVDLRLLPEALRMSRRAVREFDAHGVPLMAAEARWRLARLALLTGAFDDAEEAAAASATTFRAQRRRVWALRAELVRLDARARAGRATEPDVAAMRRAARALAVRQLTALAVEAHLAAGRAALALDRPRWAMEDLAAARTLARRGAFLPRLNGRVAAALAARADGNRGAALRHCRAGLEGLARHRAGLASMELRALASGHGAELGRLGLSMALESGSPVRVLEWMERTRAAALVVAEQAEVHSDPTAAAAGPGAVDAPRLREQSSARGGAARLADLRSVRRDIESAGGPGEASVDLLRRLRAAEDELRRADWSRSGGAAAMDVVPIAALRAALAGRTLVEYAALDGEVCAVVLDARRSRLVRLGALPELEHEMESALFALRRLATATRTRASMARSSLEVGLARMTDLLMAPLELDPAAELVVVPPAPLQRAPWTALHPGPLALSPSSSLWARTRTAAASAGQVVLVCGPGLDGAAQEVEALRRLYPGATTLVPPDSTVVRVADAISGADLVHLACHGQVRSDNPTFSALQLSDGQLTVHEIDLRGLAPRRVVLAACDSGADVPYEGNEMLGFVSALFARGASAVLASVVSIPDLMTDQLMLALHHRLQAGDRFATALHAARGSLDLADARSFANWCSFSAYGAG